MWPHRGPRPLLDSTRCRTEVMLSRVPQTRTVSTRIAWGLVRTLEALGVPGDVRKLVPVPMQAAADPDSFVPATVLYDVWEYGAAARPSPALPIDVVDRVRTPPPADVFSFVLRTSRTIGDALRLAERYLAARATSFTWELRHEGGLVYWLQHRPPSPRLGRRLAVEATLAEAVNIFRTQFSESFAPERVMFGHSAPADTKAHRAYFAAPIVFGAGSDGLVFPESLLRAPMPNADAAMADYFDERCREALESLVRVDDDVVERVRDLVLRALPELPAVAHVARHVHVSERTLRRRLAERNTSYDAVLSSTRVALATQHLARRDLAIAEVAYLVGFSETSAFHRFFKRETGRTPAQHRAALDGNS